METISLPIKFTNNHLEIIEPGTDKYYNHLIALAVQIAPGEMPLDVDYGVRDMAFTDTSNASIGQVLSLYFPELSIDSVRVAKDMKTSNFFIDISYTY